MYRAISLMGLAVWHAEWRLGRAAVAFALLGAMMGASSMSRHVVDLLVGERRVGLVLGVFLRDSL